MAAAAEVTGRRTALVTGASGGIGAELARLFARELGMSFGQWRQQVRLAHGASLIARGMPLWQVAHETSLKIGPSPVFGANCRPNSVLRLARMSLADRLEKWSDVRRYLAASLG